MKVAIIGGSGFIGRNVAEIFDNPLIIDSKNFNQQIDKIRDYDVVINLAGKPIVKRWSKKYKKELYSSRIKTTKKIVEIINDSNVKHFISTSAIGYYPNPCECDEDSKSGNGFLAKLAIDWEKEAFKCTKPTTIFRFSVVLGDDGALAKMLLPFKMGVGGIIGDGKQKFSWIDIEDVKNIYKLVIDNQIEGVLNLSSDEIVTNYQFTKTLAKTLNRPAILPMPVFMIKVIFGEASEVLISNQAMKPKKLLELGYKFNSLENCLKRLV